ncbi:FHA domain-containing protein [Candidatus Poribacteria bacterium]|jgi:pSer/pThr/pTyr-binding forkhead associated (FHA) protein|nr:FHA domain-containing protein [Candidatus Poribacteria bacterium]MBT5532405.1 FHA domain-containing protein [Candidatus Poribacteria bacterium]MBT5710583.1 FHA domain-containing protein [Candidatus Poribacteria bacterium]MBT7098714.1 FHA domain-containing protein [Candidatus Poribacteria bacterium]MBT7807668.1 FHA domain-containing protein [Candidatus Poribacteria bacterium]
MNRYDADRDECREGELSEALEAHTRYREGNRLTRDEQKALHKWTGDGEFEGLKTTIRAVRKETMRGGDERDPQIQARVARLKVKTLRSFRDVQRRSRIAASPLPAGTDSELVQASYSDRQAAMDTFPSVPRAVEAVDMPSRTARSDSVLLYAEALEDDAIEPREIEIKLCEAVFGRGHVAFRVEGDGQISRRHTRVLLLDGEVVVTDLGSQNGTLVNGERIDEPTPIEIGCVVEMGGTKLTLEQIESETRGYARAIFGSATGDRYVVDLSEVVLGRGRKATVSLHDSSRRLSRRHARLDLCDGKVFVTDLESMNGVIVNASRIDGSAQIESESLVQFGGAEIRVVGMIRC